MQKEMFVTPLPLEAIDQIRVERESVHPAIHKYAEELAAAGNEVFLTKYSEYLDDRTIERSRDIHKRIIIGDAIENDFNAWCGDTLARQQKMSKFELDGFTGENHGIIYIENPLGAWQALPGYMAEEYQQSFGEYALAEFTGVFLNQTILHEIVHQYQPRRLVEDVAESSARFVEQELIEIQDAGFIRSSTDHVFTACFGLLIEEYGRESVLRHAFGTLRDFSLSHEMDKFARNYLNTYYKRNY